MSELLRALVLGPARAERLRATVTVVAVALGVALSLAIRLANATAVASFAHSVDVIANRVNVQILGVDRGFDERVFPRLATLPGVEQASPAIEDSLAAGVRKGAPFSGEILRVLGLDLIAAPADGLASQGALPQGLAASAQRLDPRVLIAGDGALVSAAVARRFRLHVGSRFPVLVGDRPAHLQIAGILPPGLPGIDSSVVFVDVSTAQELFHKVGRLDRIDLIVAPQHFARTLAAIRAILPPGARALEPRVRTSEIRRMLQSFQLNLAALADVALLVGMFLIYNAVAISVVQRRDAIGTARALGATRAEILRTFLTEGALYGLFGSLLGLLLGAFLARVCVTAVVGTVSELYVGTHADGVAFEPSIFAESFALGVALSILSALVPAREAARTPPALAMRSHGFEGPRARPGIGLALAGCGLLLVAAALARLPAQHGVPVFGYAAGLAIIFGIALVVPLLIRLASGGLRRAAGGRAPLAHLAAANLGAALRRNAVAVASLGVAVGTMVAIAILVGSFRTTVVTWSRETIKADLFVRPLGPTDASYDALLSAGAVARIARVRGVAAADTFRAITIPLHGTLTNLAATDIAAVVRRNKLQLLAGPDPQALARGMPGTDEALASEPFVTRFGLGTGALVPIATPSGNVRLRIVGIYNDYSSDAGILLISERTFARLFRDTNVNSVAIYAKPGIDLLDLRTRVIRAALPARIDVVTTRELRALVVEIFNRTFAVTYALYVIALAIAVMGVVSTLFALVLERKREIGLLRYLGLARGGVRRMVLYEAAAIGGLGGLAGFLIGVPLALLLIDVINRQAFGWLIELHVPYGFLLQALALVVLAALAAGLYPAGIAARIRTADAVRTE